MLDVCYVCTRPDISFIIGLLSHFQSNLSHAHCSVVKRVLRYMRGTTNYMLCYGGSDWRLHSYIDVNYANDLDGRKSTSVYTLLGG